VHWILNNANKYGNAHIIIKIGIRINPYPANVENMVSS